MTDLPPLSGRALLWRMARAIIVFIIIFFILVILVINTSPGHAALREPSASKANLQLDKDGDFRIAIFSDLHYGAQEDGWGIEQDQNTTRVMSSVLRDEKVDFVVLNGDLITGENTLRENASDYVEQIIRPMLQSNKPWASVYGNHDSQFNLSREAIYKAERVYSLCYTDSVDHLPGSSNYYVLIHPHQEEGAEPEGLDPAAILWFFDSRGGKAFDHDPSSDTADLPDWVAPETSKWFIEAHNELREKYDNRVIPSIAFVHIPPHIFSQAQEAGVHVDLFPGLNDDMPLAFQGNEGEDAAFVNALLQTEGLHSVHVGHDHGDSWCSTWPGKDATSKAPFLCFAKHTGYGGYGTWNRGARILHLTISKAEGENQGGKLFVDTWVGMENGNVVTQVSLNETYGVDRYPTGTGEP
ncbi:hypothetical protein VdG2_07838 [Verticillium dahliae VDG2]|nr:hypothetical protein VdG2_07838 [Verticillium dahliae VDG2]